MAYKYSNILASKAHTFGTHMFAALNDYTIGSVVESCEVTNEYYKMVSERNLISRNKNNAANIAYRNKNYKTAALLYTELAEEGHQFADINSAVLFYYYQIFNNQTYNDYMAFKYFKRKSDDKDAMSFLFLADIYYTG